MKKIAIFCWMSMLTFNSLVWAKTLPIPTEIKTIEDSTPIQPRGTFYRCDGCHPALASEWFQLAYNDEMDEVVGLWYWDTKNDQKIELILLEQQVIADEEFGSVGEFKFPNSPFVYEFGAIDRFFNVTDSDGNRFEYEAEGFEEEDGDIRFFLLDLDFDLD